MPLQSHETSDTLVLLFTFTVRLCNRSPKRWLLLTLVRVIVPWLFKERIELYSADNGNAWLVGWKIRRGEIVRPL